MKNKEILDTLIEMSTLQLNTLHKVKELLCVDEKPDQILNAIAVEDTTRYAKKRHSQLSEKLMDDLRKTCF